MKTTRRNFIAKSVLTAAGVTAGVNSGILNGSSVRADKINPGLAKDRKSVV